MASSPGDASPDARATHGPAAQACSTSRAAGVTAASSHSRQADGFTPWRAPRPSQAPSVASAGNDCSDDASASAAGSQGSARRTRLPLIGPTRGVNSLGGMQ